MDPWERSARFLFEAGQLSRTPRSGYSLLRCAGQSVSDHVYRTSMVAYVLARHAGDADVGRVLMMAILHDLPESRTMDLNGLSKRYLHVALDRVLSDQTEGLAFGEEARLVIEEYEAGETVEARLVRDADQIELLLTLREQERVGGELAKSWIARGLERIRTDAGRKLANAIVAVDPDEWWAEPESP